MTINDWIGNHPWKTAMIASFICSFVAIPILSVTSNVSKYNPFNWNAYFLGAVPFAIIVCFIPVCIIEVINKYNKSKEEKIGTIYKS